MKARTIMLPKKFPCGHRKKGQPNYYIQLIDLGIKKHLLKQNCEFWEDTIKKVQKGELCLSVCVRYFNSGKLNTKELYRLSKYSNVGIEIITQLDFVKKLIYIEGKPVNMEEVAFNNGLSLNDFISMFSAVTFDISKQFCIIHLTEFRYNKH